MHGLKMPAIVYEPILPSNSSKQPTNTNLHKVKKMLRLQVPSHCIISHGRPIKTGSSNSGLWVLPLKRVQYPSRWNCVQALKDEPGGGGRGFAGRNWDPGLEIEVPFEQRPVNEYSSLKDEVLYSWGELSAGPFFLRLGGLWLVAFTVLGAPIAAASFNPSREPLRFVLAAGTGTLFMVALVVLRIYLGWSYVGDRLLSAVIPYEESGWYDGQMWVKPPEAGKSSSFLDEHGDRILEVLLPMGSWGVIDKVLARDRLLGSYKVKPVIKLLKQTLVGTGALLVTAALLFFFATPVEDFFRSTFADKETVQASKTSTKSNIRKEELLRLPLDVKGDDDLAAAAAEAADGRPVYCRDRFYRALAGGQYCKWEDLLN